MNKKELERLPVRNIEVTEVKIYPFDTTGIGGNVKAVASIKLNDILEIKDIKIVYSNNGYFIQMPSKKTRTGEFVPVVNPLNKNLYLHIRRKILDAYKCAMRKYDEKINSGT
ncbi:SpoVG family protein [Desulfurobacterium thermolithotrophum DSM 11699]|uniref:SpoVG family protein n=1 Tax=Desulfurobacterium thermolithotrophum (strain DSM 11699 / BSA) TaxID=868864 RepID=F0S3H8_DESTD|nr:SpoVG family protein [Desulfurobacterium thermolithotrophum]ADY73400.1 SpoVG family protein [Desulfurobacterium thermolithotrophum DSM 11699]